MGVSGDTTAQPRQSRSPNVVLIVLDDLGFADLGCFGSPVATPRIDELAEGGLRYNGFHVTAICSASRACLLTGRNHHAVGMGYLTQFSFTYPGYTTRIPKSAGALPRVLRDAGYNTFAVGKWHLTPSAEVGPAGPFDRWPLGLGFERFYGFLGGMTSQWAPDLVSDNSLLDHRHPIEGYHLTEDLTSRAMRMVQDQQQAAPDKPFFLYFAPGAMHAPHQVHASWINHYSGAFDDGWEARRDVTFERQVAQGIVPPATTLTGRPPWVAPWDELRVSERRLYSRMMEVYAGFLSHTDAQIGRLVDFLATLGALENTIIMIVSDNGAAADSGPHGSLVFPGDELGRLLERIEDLGGHHSPYSHYAWGWAWAGNTPFKLWKHYAWLGGVRVPFVLHWPTGIDAHHRGQIRTQFSHAIDLMPTILDAAGVDVPEELDGVQQQPVDGASLLTTLQDPDVESPRRTQYFEVGGSRAIYHDGWKATTDHVGAYAHERGVIEGSVNFDQDRWFLYDLTSDFSEAHDLSDAHPDRLRHLTDLWWHEAGRNNVSPLMDNPQASALALQPIEGLEPRRTPERYVYTLRPGGGPIDIPSPFRTGFTLTATIEAPANAGGVIWSQWSFLSGISFPGGWSCSLDNGRLVVELDVDEIQPAVVAALPFSAGNHTLELTYVPAADGPGTLAAGIDETQAAKVTVPVGPWMSRRKAMGAKLQVGRDHGFPARDRSGPREAFAGVIHQLSYVVKAPPDHDFRSEVQAAMRHD